MNSKLSSLNTCIMALCCILLTVQCTNSNPAADTTPQEPLEKTGFDTSGINIKYALAQHPDSLVKAHGIKCQYMVYQTKGDSVVNQYDRKGNFVQQSVYDQDKKLVRQVKNQFDAKGLRTQSETSENGQLLYREVFSYNDTLLVESFTFKVDGKTVLDTMRHYKYTHNSQQQRATQWLVIFEKPMITHYKYWPNGLLKTEIFIGEDSSTTTTKHYYNTNGWRIRSTQNNYMGPYTRHCDYDEQGRPLSITETLGRIRISTTYQYNEKNLPVVAQTYNNPGKPEQIKYGYIYW